MRHTPLLRLATLLSMLLLLAACTTPTSIGTTPTHDATSTTSHSSLYVLDGPASPPANSASLHIIGIHPGTTDPPITLPTGLISPDHLRIFTASPHNGQTLITITNTQTATAITTLTIPGTYTTDGNYYTNAILSPNAHWLALRQISASGSRIALIESTTLKLSRTIQLTGTFDLDALSNDGLNIYLLERLNANGDYHVRLYQVATQQLLAQAIVDKSDINEKMVGTPLTRQVAPDGSAVYTLYTQPAQNKAFIHILPLGALPFARCIDLPVGTAPELLTYYSLTLSHDGHTLYAVNGALGLVGVIRLATENLLNTAAAITQIFPADNTQLTHQEQGYQLFHGSALSADNKTLYVVGMHGITAMNTDTFQVQATYLAQQALTGLALNGKLLYAVGPKSGITQIDLATGQIQQLAENHTLSPWGIAWINGA